MKIIITLILIILGFLTIYNSKKIILKLDEIDIKDNVKFIYFYYILFILNLFFLEVSNSELIIYCIVFLLLYLISLIDIRCGIIPDKYNILILILGSLNIALGNSLLINSLKGMFPILILLAIVLITEWIVKDEVMGGGDIKLYLSLSFLLGLKYTLILLFLSNLFIVTKNKNDKYKFLPFAPYIFAGYGLLFITSKILDSLILM